VKSSCSGGGGVSEWLESRGTLEQIDREHMTTVLTAARLGLAVCACPQPCRPLPPITLLRAVRRAVDERCRPRVPPP